MSGSVRFNLRSIWPFVLSWTAHSPAFPRDNACHPPGTLSSSSPLTPSKGFSLHPGIMAEVHVCSFVTFVDNLLPVTVVIGEMP